MAKGGGVWKYPQVRTAASYRARARTRTDRARAGRGELPARLICEAVEPQRGARHGTCQWISGTPSASPEFCGAPVVRGRSYCPAHLAAAYGVPPPPVKEPPVAPRVEPPPSAGSNVTPETVLQHWREISRTAREAREAQSKARHARKRAKDAGINMSAFAMLETLAKLDTEDATLRLRDTLRMAAWLELPLGQQANLFGFDDAQRPSEKASAEQREWAAEETGYEAGRAGRAGDDTPYPAGSPLHQRWYTGWTRGQAAIAEGMGPKPKRGRKGKTGNPEMGPEA